jgi:hypothetical protein
VSWQEGKETIDRLLAARELQNVSPDLKVAHQLLGTARKHLASARDLQSEDPEGAYAVLYDAARKSCAALLQAQGLRPTSRGGHIAVREAVLAQFGALSGGHVLRPFDRLRRRRNEMEYPSGESAMDDDEISEALTRAEQMVEFAEKLIDTLPVY